MSRKSLLADLFWVCTLKMYIGYGCPQFLYHMMSVSSCCPALWLISAYFPSLFPCCCSSLLSVPASALAFACLHIPQVNRLCMASINLCNIFKCYCEIHYLFLSCNFFVWIIAIFPTPLSNPAVSLLLFDHHCLLWVLFRVTSSFHLFFHPHVSPPVGAGCAQRPSSISLTCRSTPNRTQRPNLTSVPTVTSHSPTPATWRSTSVSTAGPSPTPAPTARNLSGNSVIYSSTHGTWDQTPPYSRLVPCSCVCSPAKFFWKPRLLEIISFLFGKMFEASECKYLLPNADRMHPCYLECTALSCFGWSYENGLFHYVFICVVSSLASLRTFASHFPVWHFEILLVFCRTSCHCLLFLHTCITFLP